jgi:uncharacterized protein YndB with AHSA1/START domain
MTTVADMTNAPVQKTVTVKASPERAFAVFTEGFDTWWPRSHKLSEADLEKAVIEARLDGRCYQRAVDGTECEWGRVIVWEPPQRFVIAWQLNEHWQYEPDLVKASEVEVRFTPEPGGSTRVDLEHRHFERHGAGGNLLRTGVDGEMGWAGLLQLFAARIAAAE